jgi:hypothetical protein
MARFVRWDIPGRSFLEPTIETMNGIEEAIRWAQTECPRRMPREMDKLVMYMALVNQGFARKMAFGPLDPSGRRSELAWRTPSEGIRRISQDYYLGWKVKRVGMGHWRLYNDSREAYYIEFGISQVGFGGTRYVPSRRIRRPVRKLSLRKTMEFMMRTHAYHRTWVNMYCPPGQRHRGRGFLQMVQSPAQGSFRGPLPGVKLP